MNRRSLLRRGLLGGALLAVGGGVTLQLMASKQVAPRGKLRALDAKTFSVMAAVASRVVPAGDPVGIAHGADEALSYLAPETQAEIRQLLGLFENAIAGALLDRRFSPFSAASPEAQDRTLASWRDSSITLRRSGFNALRKLAIGAHWVQPSTWPAANYPGPPVLPKEL